MASVLLGRSSSGLGLGVSKVFQWFLMLPYDSLSLDICLILFGSWKRSWILAGVILATQQGCRAFALH